MFQLDFKNNKIKNNILQESKKVLKLCNFSSQKSMPKVFVFLEIFALPNRRLAQLSIFGLKNQFETKFGNQNGRDLRKSTENVQRNLNRYQKYGTQKYDYSTAMFKKRRSTS